MVLLIILETHHEQWSWGRRWETESRGSDQNQRLTNLSFINISSHRTLTLSSPRLIQQIFPGAVPTLRTEFCQIWIFCREASLQRAAVIPNIQFKVGAFENKIWAFSEYMNFNRSFVIISLLYMNYFTFNLEKKWPHCAKLEPRVAVMKIHILEHHSSNNTLWFPLFLSWPISVHLFYKKDIHLV